MILNYWQLTSGAAINIFPIGDSNTFSDGLGWKEHRAYYFTGLEYRMLICPIVLATDELLIQRPSHYLKVKLPLGAVIYFPTSPENSNHGQFLDNLGWMVDSYLFKFNASRQLARSISTPRLYVNYANSIPNHGPFVFDNARVVATPSATASINDLNKEYSQAMSSLITSCASEIHIANYAQTTLLEELCSHAKFQVETDKYIQVIADDIPDRLNSSELTNGFEHIHCSSKFNRSVLSFYLAAIKEPFPNSPGSHIGMFKNFYNVLEYLMDRDGESSLCSVLRERVGMDRLKAILHDIMTSSHPHSTVLDRIVHGEKLSSHYTLPPLSEEDHDLAAKIAHRLYTKRNASLHSKKYHRSLPTMYSIRPGPDESGQLETDLALIRPIAEHIVESLSLLD